MVGERAVSVRVNARRVTTSTLVPLQMVNEAHARWRDRTLRDILARMRHDGCGGLAGKAEEYPRP
jgi:hypothetical protein